MIQHTRFDEEQSVDYYYADCELMMTTAFGSNYIRTANLLWGAFGRQVVVIQHTHYDEEQP